MHDGIDVWCYRAKKGDMPMTVECGVVLTISRFFIGSFFYLYYYITTKLYLHISNYFYLLLYRCMRR